MMKFWNDLNECFEKQRKVTVMGDRIAEVNEESVDEAVAKWAANIKWEWGVAGGHNGF